MSEIPRPARVGIGVDATPDLSAATVALAGIVVVDGKERMLIEVGEEETSEGMWPDHRAGTAWVVPRLKALKAAARVAAMVIDARSPAAVLLTEADKAGLDITTTSTADLGQACGQMIKWAGEGYLAHTGQPDLRIAVAGAVKRDIGDGLCAWARKATTVDISPWYAATLAAWAADKFGRGYNILNSVPGL